MRAPTALRLACRLNQFDLEPVAERLVAAPGRLGAEIAEEAHRRLAVDHDEVEHAVHVEVDRRAAAALARQRDAGGLADLGEGLVPLAEQQVVGIVGGEIGHRFDIALGDEQVEQAVIVEVGKLAVPAGRRPHVAAGIGARRGDAHGIGDVLVDRAIGVGFLVELLQLGVAHRGQRIDRIAVAVEVGLGDAHAVDRQVLPALGRGVEARRLAGIDVPHLLLAAAVVLAVVGDPQRRHARLVPVGEEHGQRAIARRQRNGVAVVRLVPRGRTVEVAVGAGAPRRARRHAVDVVADGKRREGLVLLPGRGESRRPVPAAVEGEGLVGDLEPAVGLALEDEVAAEAQHDEVHQPVIVDVERIGARDVRQVLGREIARSTLANLSAPPVGLSLR